MTERAPTTRVYRYRAAPLPDPYDDLWVGPRADAVPVAKWWVVVRPWPLNEAEWRSDWLKVSGPFETHGEARDDAAARQLQSIDWEFSAQWRI